MTNTIRDRTLPCIASLFAIFVFAVSANIFPAAQLRASAELGVEFAELGQLFSAQFVGFVLITVIGGILADYFGKKILFIAACIAIAIGSFTWAQAHTMTTAFIGGTLIGMGGGIIESLCSALISDLFPSRRKLLLNLSQVMYCVGAVGWPFLMGRFMVGDTGLSWRFFYLSLTVLSLLLLVAFAVSHIPPPTHSERIDMQQLRAIAGRPSFLLPCLILFLYVLGETATVLYTNPYLKDYLHAPEDWAIYSISCFWLTMAVGRILCAMIPESVSYEYVVAGLCAASSLTLFSQFAITSWAVSFIFFGVTGLSLAGAWPLIVGLAASHNPKYSGTVLGTTIACGACGCVAAPWLLALLENLVAPAWIFPFCGLPLFIAAIITLFMRRLPRVS